MLAAAGGGDSNVDYLESFPRLGGFVAIDLSSTVLGALELLCGEEFFHLSVKNSN